MRQTRHLVQTTIIFELIQFSTRRVIHEQWLCLAVNNSSWHKKSLPNFFQR